MGILLNK